MTQDSAERGASETKSLCPPTGLYQEPPRLGRSTEVREEAQEEEKEHDR